MKKEQNLQEPQKQALNIPVVSGNVNLTGTNNTKPANELGWDLSNVKPFDNIPSLKSKIEAISNGI
jgi:hypothetical protein